MYTRALALLAGINRFPRIYSVKGSCSWGIVATSTPKKGADDICSHGGVITKEKIDPVVTFSRPPPLPPVLGPLVALSLLQTWLNGDTGDES